MNTRRPIPLHLKFVTHYRSRFAVAYAPSRELDALSSVRISLVSSPFPEASTHTQLSGCPSVLVWQPYFFVLYRKHGIA